ncbi:MAG: TfoX/Sxy family protein [Chloroflexi bacterium]|nr:MAG: TfoX/Sxy family protein [Chloroflexota bacterium]
MARTTGCASSTRAMPRSRGSNRSLPKHTPSRSAERIVAADECGHAASPRELLDAMEENAAMAAPKGMKMPRPSEEAKAAFARIVPDEPAITIKPMFGQMSAFVNGNMFCGIYGEELMVRLSADEIAKVKKQGGRDFEPMPGHKMGGYVVVPGDWRATPPTALIKRALEETRKMPAKKPKK